MEDFLLETLRAGDGRWTRAHDDHDFRHVFPYDREGSFRLQVLTAPGCTPVAVAVQLLTGEGTSLVNAAELYTARIWRDLLPQESRPPVWVWRIQMDHDRDPGHWGWVTFEQAEPYVVADPRFHSVTRQHQTLLAATGASPDRGRLSQTRVGLPRPGQ